MPPSSDTPQHPAPARRPPVPGPIGKLLERAYRWELNRRNRAFDAGIGVHAAPVPVVSIGNLSVGGTGKTPMVRAIVGWLREAGHHPAIAMRGYKARQGVSDEAAEYEYELPGIPIALGPDRCATIHTLRDRLGADAFDVVVLDDGFQHRRLARALDIVLLDATRWPFHDRCLPAGWLREPAEALARAHIAIITRVDQTEHHPGWQALAEELKHRFPHLHIAACAHRWDGFTIASDPARAEPAAWISGRPVVIACGIGHPDAFIAQATAAGAAVREVVRRADHHHWSADDARHLTAALDGAGPDALLLTTMKDWVKLGPVADPALHRRVALPRLSLGFLLGESGARELVLRAARATPGDARHTPDHAEPRASG